MCSMDWLEFKLSRPCFGVRKSENVIRKCNTCLFEIDREREREWERERERRWNRMAWELRLGLGDVFHRMFDSSIIFSMIRCANWVLLGERAYEWHIDDGTGMKIPNHIKLYLYTPHSTAQHSNIAHSTFNAINTIWRTLASNNSLKTNTRNDWILSH